MIGHDAFLRCYATCSNSSLRREDTVKYLGKLPFVFHDFGYPDLYNIIYI